MAGATTTTDNNSVRSSKLSVDALDAAHRDALTKAISRVLSTKLAEMTYAQIVDGLPLESVARDGMDLESGHPFLDAHHVELCPGVLERTREFRANFKAEKLEFNAKLIIKVILSYQASGLGSRSFKQRLIELVAVSVHQIAVILFQMDGSLHKASGIAGWQPPRSDESFWEASPKGLPPTLFYHHWYRDHEQYPAGIADLAGYWAESRILGGVILFDRRNKSSDTVYIHPERRYVTYRICKLLDEQKRALLDFLTADAPPDSHLPILPDQNNLQRVDPEEPLSRTGVYRDFWERKDLPLEGWDSRMKDVLYRIDYPTDKDFGESQGRGYARKQRAIKMAGGIADDEWLLEQDELNEEDRCDDCNR